MTGPTQEQIQEQIETNLATVEGYGVVLTDTKFTQGSGDLHDLLAGQQGERASGWVLTLKEIAGYEVDGDCKVNITFRYRLTRFSPYLNGSPDEVTSQAVFLKLIDESLDALNADRIFAALANQAEIVSITTRGEFTVIDWLNTAQPDTSHFGEFDVDVKVERNY